MSTELPSWLDSPPITSTPEPAPASQPAPPAPVKRSGKELTYEELQFENFFESAVDRIALGHPLKDIVNDDPRNLSYSRLTTWIHKDPARQQRYYEARAIGAEVVADEMIAISDGTDNPMEDVNRSKLRLDTRRWLLGVWNRKRFGGEQIGPTGGGNQPIVINIGQVESPYALGNSTAVVSDISEDVTDVEPK